MSDEPLHPPHVKTPPPSSLPAERLFEFVRASDQTPMSCDLRQHCDPGGWEVLIWARGRLFFAKGAFRSRELAVAWAEQERRALETGGDGRRSGSSVAGR